MIRHTTIDPRDIRSTPYTAHAQRDNDRKELEESRPISEQDSQNILDYVNKAPRSICVQDIATAYDLHPQRVKGALDKMASLADIKRLFNGRYVSFRLWNKFDEDTRFEENNKR